MNMVKKYLVSHFGEEKAKKALDDARTKAQWYSALGLQPQLMKNSKMNH